MRFITVQYKALGRRSSHW